MFMIKDSFELYREAVVRASMYLFSQSHLAAVCPTRVGFDPVRFNSFQKGKTRASRRVTERVLSRASNLL